MLTKFDGNVRISFQNFNEVRMSQKWGSVMVIEIWRFYEEFRNYVQEISFLLFLVELQVRTPTHPPFAIKWGFDDCLIWGLRDI